MHFLHQFAPTTLHKMEPFAQILRHLAQGLARLNSEIDVVFPTFFYSFQPEFLLFLKRNFHILLMAAGKPDYTKKGKFKNKLNDFLDDLCKSSAGRTSIW